MGPPGDAPTSRGWLAPGAKSFAPFRLLRRLAVSGRAAASDPSVVEIPIAFGRFDRCRLPPELRSTESAESTATIWRCRSARAAALGGGGSALSAFVARTPAPRASMAVRNTRARFSAGVGMREDRVIGRGLAHRSDASGHNTKRRRDHGHCWRTTGAHRSVRAQRDPLHAFIRRQ
jgi:hypothetical protein